MIKAFFKLTVALISILAIFILHIAAVNFLPFPLNRINLMFLALVWLAINKGIAYVVWVGLILSFLAELFSPAPFGVNMAALLGSLIILDWFLANVFTNHSWYIVFFSGLIGLICYRVGFFLFLGAVAIIKQDTLSFNLPLVTDIALEVVLTATTLAGLYLATALFLKRLDPKYITVNVRL